MTRSKAYDVLVPLLMCVAVLTCIGTAWRLVDNPALEQLKAEAGALLLLVWVCSAAWFLSRCASGTVFPRAEPAEPCWTAVHVALAFLLFLLLPATFAQIARQWLPAHDLTAGILAVSSLAELLVVYIVLVMIRQHGRNPAEALGLGPGNSDGRVAAGLITFMAGMPVVLLASLFWTGLVQKLVGEGTDLRQNLVRVFDETTSSSLRTQIAVAAVLVAPVVEEFLFRGLLYGLLRRHVRPLLAMIAVGMLFGAVHDSLASFVPLSLLGVFLCYLYEKTGRLSVPIIAHLMFNGIMTVLMEIFRSSH